MDIRLVFHTEANGDENYLNQPSDFIFNQDKLPILEINLPEGALTYINSDQLQRNKVEGV